MFFSIEYQHKNTGLRPPDQPPFAASPRINQSRDTVEGGANQEVRHEYDQQDAAASAAAAAAAAARDTTADHGTRKRLH